MAHYSNMSDYPNMSNMSDNPNLFDNPENPNPSISSMMSIPGISSMMPNPGISSMMPDPGISSMMTNPGISSMMTNPGISSMMTNPGISSMMTNPGISSMMPNPGISSMMPNPGTSSMMPNPGISSMMPNPGTSSMMPNPGTSSMMPNPHISSMMANPNFSGMMPNPNIPNPNVPIRLRRAKSEVAHAHNRSSVTTLRQDFRTNFFRRLRTSRSKSVDRFRQIVEHYGDNIHYRSVSDLRKVLLCDREATELLMTEEVNAILNEVEKELAKFGLQEEGEQYVQQAELETQDMVNRHMMICGVCDRLNNAGNICAACSVIFQTDFKC